MLFPDWRVKLRNVSVNFGGKRILHGLNWELAPGTNWAVFGPNGAGKSTFLRLLRGEVRPEQHFGAQDNPPYCAWNFPGAAPEPQNPEYRQNWPDTSPLAVRPLSSLLSPEMQRHYVRQNWRINGEEVVLSGLSGGYMLYSAPIEEERRLARATAARIGAEHLLELEPGAMSQGQLRLVLLARALVSEPRLLLLDEAADGLDKDSRKLFFSALDEMAARPDIPGGCSIIYVTHRAEDLPGCVTHAMAINDGRIVKQGPLEEWKDVRNRLRPERQESASLEEKTDSRENHGAEDYPPPVFILENADVYLQRKKILHGVNWRVNQGENWLLGGPNGSGKSTLLRLLMGEEHPALGGNLTWFGSEGAEARPTLEERRSFIGYVSDWLQNNYVYELSGFDLALSGLHGTIGLYRESSPAEEARAGEVIAMLGLEEYQHRLNSEMSEGTLRRFLLARAVAPAPRLLLLDEPCSGLDYSARRAFLADVRKIAANGTNLIMVSHNQTDLDELDAVLTHEIRLQEGKVEYAGPIRRAL